MMWLYLASIFFCGVGLKAEKITITSDQQRVTGGSHYHCRDKVTVRYGDRILIFADTASFDKNTNSVVFPDHLYHPITIQTGDYLILARSGMLEGNKDEADFSDVELYTKAEVISAKKAHKAADGTWTFDAVTYTPCSCEKAHWRFTAAQALLKKDKHCSLRQPRAVFNERLNVWLPSTSVALADASGRSGFLFPVPIIHGRGDFSLYQAYYINIAPTVDTTVGVFARTNQGVLADQEIRYLGDNGACYAKIYGGKLHPPGENFNPYWGWANAHASYASGAYETVVADVFYGRLGQQSLFFHDRVPRADEASGWTRFSTPMGKTKRAVAQIGACRTLRFPKALNEDTTWRREALLDGLVYTSENYLSLGSIFLSNRIEGEFLVSQQNAFDPTPSSTYENDFSFHAAYAPTFFMNHDNLSLEAGVAVGGVLERQGEGVVARPLVEGTAVATMRLAEFDLDNGLYAFEVGALAESSTPRFSTFTDDKQRYLFARGIRDVYGEGYFATTTFEQRFSFTRPASSAFFLESDWQGERWHAYCSLLTNLILPRVDELQWHFLFRPVETFKTGIVGRYISTQHRTTEYAQNKSKAAWHSELTLGDNAITTELGFAQRKYGNGLIYPQSFAISLDHSYDCWSWSLGYQYSRFIEDGSQSDWAISMRLSFGELLEVKQNLSW